MDFLRAEERYVLEWPKKPKTVKVEEYDLPMPKLPDESLIKNSTLKSKDQFYTREVVPADIHTWPQREIDEYAKAQWHRRLNGEWQMINGKPYYIPGCGIYFYDFWTLESGQKPEFRYSALTLHWLFANYVEPHPDIFGIYVLKTRRIGDTANFIAMLHERITRYKGVRGGLQSYNDNMGSKTFARMAKGARNMPYFFSPNRSGSDKEFLAYMAPNNVMTMKKIKEKELFSDASGDSEFLNSFLDYEATVEGAYDGEWLFGMLLDEVLKIPPYKMDAIKQFNNLRRCMSLFGEDVIRGKGFVSSTVEKREKKTARPGEDDMSTIEVGNWFWDNSDPAMLKESPDGRTVSGLVRIFRGYQMGAKPDPYGFPQEERATKKREAKLEKALKYNQPDAITDIYRKEPGSPEEALIEDNENCPLYPEICQLRAGQIEKGLDRWGNRIEGYRPKVVEGILRWVNDKPNSEVEFVPQKGGPWNISQMPIAPNQVDVREVKMMDEYGQVKKVSAFVPIHGAYYRSGCDPVSSNPLLVTSGSKGAIVIKRRLHLPSEPGKLEFDEKGVIQNPEDMVTNKIVADYVGRPRDPILFFEEIAKSCWFFSTPVMLEMDKPEAYVWLRRNGYLGMVMYEPPQIARLRSRGKNSYFPGVRSKSDIVGMYVSRQKTYITNYWAAIDHPRILQQAKRFVTRKRTKFDLICAWGMCEIGDMETRYTEPGQNGKDNRGWKTDPYALTQ